MRIRPAGPEDVPSVARVHVDTWRTAYRGILPDDYLEGLSYADHERRRREWMEKNPQTFTLVAEEDGIVGFADAGPERKNDPDFEGELYAIYVLGSTQRRGIGRALFDAVLRGLLDRGWSSMLVWVLRENPWRRFYEKHGGAVVRRGKIELGGKLLDEVGYGWRDLKSHVATPAAP